MRQLGIDGLSVFGLPPVPFVELCADLGCQFVSLGAPVACNPEDYPAYDLHDPAVRREVKAVLRERGIALAMGDGLFITPERDAKSFAAHLDVMADLGAATINMIAIGMDLPLSLDQFAILAEMAAERGISNLIEFCPGLAVCDLDTAVSVLKHLGRTDVKLVLDFMHVVRSGATIAQIASLDPNLIVRIGVQ